MLSPELSRTSTTLLGRLRHAPEDQEAWGAFVERYGPKIYRWCRHWKIQDADAQDVTQDVLLKLVERLRTFDYDPSGSFRGWLRTVTERALSDYLDACKRRRAGVGNVFLWQCLENVEARIDLIQSLREQFDGEVLDEARARIQLRVAPHTWEVFRRTAMENEAAAAVAREMGIQVGTVYVAKSKVQKMLRAEVQKLEAR